MGGGGVLLLLFLPRQCRINHKRATLACDVTKHVCISPAGEHSPIDLNLLLPCLFLSSLLSSGSNKGC